MHCGYRAKQFVKNAHAPAHLAFNLSFNGLHCSLQLPKPALHICLHALQLVLLLLQGAAQRGCCLCLLLCQLLPQQLLGKLGINLWQHAVATAAATAAAV